MKILALMLFFLPHFFKAQALSKKDSVLIGKWLFVYLDTTINSKKQEAKCNASIGCQYIEFTSEKKYTVLYGNTINETGKWKFKNDSLYRYERVAEKAFPVKLNLGDSRMKLERIKKRQFVISAYESGKRIKGEPKGFLFYRKLD